MNMKIITGTFDHNHKGIEQKDIKFSVCVDAELLASGDFSIEGLIFDEYGANLSLYGDITAKVEGVFDLNDNKKVKNMPICEGDKVKVVNEGECPYYSIGDVGFVRAKSELGWWVDFSSHQQSPFGDGKWSVPEENLEVIG